MGAGTWIAVLLLANARTLSGAEAVSRPTRERRSRSRSQPSSAWGRRPASSLLHAWLPRAHPIAPAHVSALMSGVMIKIAIYGLVRVLVEWLGELPTWFGVVVLAVGGAVGRDRRRVRDLPARAEAAARVPLDRERRDHRARARRLPSPAASGRGRLGRRRACGSAPAHAQPRRLQEPPLPRRRRVRAARSGRSRSTASEGSCSGCRGPAARSSSARWRSPGCRR